MQSTTSGTVELEDSDARLVSAMVPRRILRDGKTSPLACLMMGVIISAPQPWKDDYLRHPETMADILGTTEQRARRLFRELMRNGYLVRREKRPEPSPTERVESRVPTPLATPTVPVGYIYVLQAGDAYKIGKAKHYGNRLAQHRAATPHQLVEVMHEKVRDYERIEIGLHRAYQDKQIRTEWFRLADEDVAEIREALADARA